VQVLYNNNGEVAMALPNEWSPRLGVVYDPTHSGRSRFYANFARYYESVPLDIAERALSGESQVIPGLIANSNAVGLPIPSNCNPRDPNSLRGPDCAPNLAWQPIFTNAFMPSNRYGQIGGGRIAVDPDLKAQSNDEIVLGGEYEVIPSGRLGLSYMHRYINHAVDDISRTNAYTYMIANPGEGIASDFPKAKRNYDAVTLYFEKNWKRQWLAQGSYTVAWLRGNYPGFYNPGPSLQLDPNNTSQFDLKSLMTNQDGWLPGDHRHQIKAFGARQFDLPRGMAITAGIGYRGHSGDPTNYLANHSLAGNSEIFILPRGSGERTEWVHSIDPHIGYSVGIGKTSRLEVSADIFNVFNFQAVTRRDETFTFTGDVPSIADGSVADLEGCRTATGRCKLTDNSGTRIDPSKLNANFGKPIAYQEPLTVRFGARLTF
jgi:hypothetical protein